MKFPVEWLKDFVDSAPSTDELADGLTMAGLEVEEIAEFTPEKMTRLGGSPTGPSGSVFDIKITPNRGDCLSILGIAREVSAIFGTDYTAPSPLKEGQGSGQPPTSSAIKISIPAPDLCRRYAGGLVRGVKIKESPEWMQNRLIMAGMRPINNVVDITNYVMLEYGQPLHAFDYRLLRGAEIIVRRANPGEKMTTIDGVERELSTDMLVIADRDGAVAIAGVMGGSESEVSEETVDVLIESANFDPVSVRRTSKTLGLSTESSYRFERAVDPSVTVLALNRACELLRDLADAEIAEGIVDVYPTVIEPRVIELRPGRVNRILGSNIDASEMAQLLHSLAMSVNEEDDTLRVTVPTCRSDIVEEIDLIEEVVRLYGFDKVGMTLPVSPSAHGIEAATSRFESRLRDLLMRSGGQDVTTNSFADPSLVDMTGLSDQALIIRNPLSEDLSRLRIALIPNLLQVLSRNAAFGVKDLSVFEIGRVYRRDNGNISQKRSVAGAMLGSQWKSAWNIDRSTLDADFYLCKGVVEALLDALGIVDCEFVPVQAPMLHPTRAALVRSQGREIGTLGEVAESVREQFDLRGRPCVFEMDFDALMALEVKGQGYRPVARYPSVYRDLSAIIDVDTPYAQVRDVILRTGGDLIETVELREVYAGPQLEPGRKSLLLSIAFRSAERTLTDQLVNERLERIMDALTGELSATIRGGVKGEGAVDGGKTH